MGEVGRTSCPPELDPFRSLTPRAREIAVVARELVETEGWDAWSMHRLASRLGIRAPSLYKHYSGKSAVRAVLAGVALAEMGEALHAVLERGGGVTELLRSYREVAMANPGLYRVATTGALPRAQLPEGLEHWAGAPFVILAGEAERGRVLWSLAHGMTILELDGRYPADAVPESTILAAAAMFSRN